MRLNPRATIGRPAPSAVPSAVFGSSSTVMVAGPRLACHRRQSCPIYNHGSVRLNGLAWSIYACDCCTSTCGGEGTAGAHIKRDERRKQHLRCTNTAANPKHPAYQLHPDDTCALPLYDSGAANLGRRGTALGKSRRGAWLPSHGLAPMGGTAAAGGGGTSHLHHLDAQTPDGSIRLLEVTVRLLEVCARCGVGRASAPAVFWQRHSCRCSYHR